MGEREDTEEEVDEGDHSVEFTRTLSLLLISGVFIYKNDVKGKTERFI